MYQATLDWSDPETRIVEDEIRFTVEKKLGERWKHFKATLRRNWYSPAVGTPERLVCGDKRVPKDDWIALVAHWEGIVGQVKILIWIQVFSQNSNVYHGHKQGACVYFQA